MTSTTMENTPNEGLKRELGIIDVATNVVNISIASGIFLLPAIIAGILGNASIVAYGLCGSMFLLVALCYAEVGSRITTSGGAYAYVEKAFGDYFGFLANVFLWFGAGVLGAAALINGVSDLLSVSFPIFNQPIFRGLFFFLVFFFFAFLNILGVKQGMTVVKTITAIKILPLVLLVIIGLFHLQFQNLQWEGFPTLEKLGSVTIILFFAFAGGESAVNMSGEMRDPYRTAPLGLILGVVVIVVFYTLIQIVAQSTLGSTLGDQKAPLSAVAGILFGTWGSQLLIAAGVMSIISSLYSFPIVYSRTLFAGANDGLLPQFLSKVHPKYATPHWAIITFSVGALVMALSGGFKQLLILATLCLLLLYVGVALAAIKFRISGSKDYPAKFLLPGGLFIPILTLVVLTWFLFQSKREEFVSMAIFIGVLTVLYGLKVLVFRKIQ
jgi:basic amino acid/polyamine antiporter, APA family